MNEKELKEIDELATGIVEKYRKRIKELESPFDGKIDEIEERLLKTPFATKQSRDDVHYLLSYIRRGTCCNLLCQTEKLQFEQSMIDWKRDWQLEMAHSSQLEKKCEILKSAVDRWVPCPDHRDKTEIGKCYICELEKCQGEKKELELRIAVLELPAQNYNKTLCRAENAEAMVKELEIALVNQMNVAGELKVYLNNAKKKIEELEKGIERAIELIKQWHNFDPSNRLSDAQRKEMWRIYYQHSPEMMPIRKLVEKGETE